MPELIETVLNSDIQEIFDNLDEADASIAQNKDAMSYAKFIFTDSEKNYNKQRVGESEFDNVVRTGVYMPFKMAVVSESLDHPQSRPIGTIIQLKKEGKQVKGIAGIWKRDFKDELDFLKESIAQGNLPQVSWELLYSESTKDEDDVEDLKGVIVKAATVVSKPAYGGRTPILAIASQTNSNSEGKELEELEQLKARVAELEALMATKDEEIKTKDASIASLSAEKEVLAQFKNEVEAAQKREERIASIKQKFAGAGIKTEEKYFEDNMEKLLAMDEATLDFHVQDLVSFSSVAVASVSDPTIAVPPLTSTPTSLTPSQIAQGLIELKKNKKL